MNKILVILVFAGLFSACGAQAEPVDTGAVQTAIAQTLMADWTATFTPKPTSTITPTWTPTATATETPTPTFTDTPTMTASPSPTPDLRVIEISLVDFMLAASDLPEGAGYSIMERQFNVIWGGRVQDIIVFKDIDVRTVSSLGLESSAFLVDDFIDGRWIRYERGISTPIYPQTVAGTVASFRSVEGARVMVNDYSLCTKRDSVYTLVETDLQIGDVTQYCTNIEMESTEYRGTYALVFSYRNFYHAIEAYGWEREVPLDFLADVARALLAKLEAAPLSDAVTFQP